METPVYLFTGFLESGKTKFIQETLEDPRFTDGTSTLVLVCEEGVEEYCESKYPAKGVHIEYIEDESELTVEKLSSLQKKHKAKRVLVEYNGMWQSVNLFYAMPEDWVLYQEMCFVDCTTFDTYNKNMRSLVVDKFNTADLVVFNRYLDKYDKMDFHKVVRGSSRGAQIVYEYPNGEAIQDDIEDPLPFDRDAEHFEVADADYALWYRDLSEDMTHYDGREVSFTALILEEKSLGEGERAAGRQIMTCCVDDITFSGLVCRFEGEVPPNGAWAKLHARIDIEFHAAYGRPGPVLTALECEPTVAPENTVATFF